ncbi:uncharacterized protein LOC62_04G005304 [Vanrija pseudolonga]|uniref:Uncharacterized protein n=1 Tax=Vanrija pseudolonga TaxID=143232 RepID=A0AAF0Y7S4_9TREE|nr:hypothetical protein LOC62_04G005304 [Vanrija pseudolonga]
MSLTIEHTAFPTIINKILKYADFPTHLAFRGTSKDFKAAIDNVIHSDAEALDSDDEPFGIEDTRNVRVIPALFVIITQLAPYLIYNGNLKIVGMEKIGDPIRYFYEPLEAFLARDPFEREYIDAIRSAITCLSFSDWWAELGSRKAIHGLWNPLAEVEVRPITDPALEGRLTAHQAGRADRAEF